MTDTVVDELDEIVNHLLHCPDCVFDPEPWFKLSHPTARREVANLHPHETLTVAAVNRIRSLAEKIVAKVEGRTDA